MRSNGRGFTVLELLLYVTICSVMLLAISVFLSILLESRVKNQTIAEVEQQGLQVGQLIAQAARNAQSITAPAAGGSASSLTLDVAASADDPTVLDLAGGAIRIQEGAGAAIPLTNSRVSASGLSIQNLSRSGTPGTVRIQFTLSYVNPSGRNEYTYSKTFSLSASLYWP